MQTTKVHKSELGREIEKGVITLSEDYGSIGAVIEEKEIEGWNFVGSKTKHGFMHLYFTQIPEE